MDVLSLQHEFGDEYQTSIKQLFIFFCNNIHIGQWQQAKAALEQLLVNKECFKFDLNNLLIDIIQNPDAYW